MSTTATTKSIRQGFHTLTPYIMVPEAAQLIHFVSTAFDAEVLLRTTGSAGGIHSEVRIGDSIVMIGGGGAWKGTPMPTALHLYVPDADRVYKRAIEAGAVSLYEPKDQPYGDREAAVKDISGNEWYIATNKETGHTPQGMHSVTVYLHSRGADKMIDFLQRAFGAEAVAVHRSQANGPVEHARIRVGTSILEMSEAHGQWQPMPTAFYMYIEDADAVYKRAIEAGATSLFAPADQPYGDRNGGVQDPFGNHWFIATHVQDVTQHSPDGEHKVRENNRAVPFTTVKEKRVRTLPRR